MNQKAQELLKKSQYNRGRKKKVTPETAVKNQVKQWLGIRGLWSFHLLADATTYPGAPDRMMPNPGGPCPHCGTPAICGGCGKPLGLFQGLEIKAPGGKPSEAQTEFKRLALVQGGRVDFISCLEELEAILHTAHKGGAIFG